MKKISGPFKAYFFNSSAAVFFIYIFHQLFGIELLVFVVMELLRWVICNITTMNLYPWN